jgi:hypothetical protein
MKTTFEMRIVGKSSQVTLSPFKVNSCDKNVACFLSIEVLTFDQPYSVFDIPAGSE